MSTKIVLLTGASGFIALHIVDVLLAKGYHVIGTIRSPEKSEELKAQFKKEHPNAHLEFEIIPDIAVEGAFSAVLKRHPEITDVLHTASPFEFGLNQDLKEAYLFPATQGTRNVLEAIKTYGPNVKHVVITSSFAAIVNRDKAGDETFIHTEETWNPMTWDDVDNEDKAYTASKKFAEVLARKYVEDEKPNFTLTTVNPAYVFGPQKFEDTLGSAHLNTSAEIVHKLLSSDPSDTHFFEEPFGTSVDVRDVALLHALPIENDKLAGKRLFPTQAAFNGQILLNIINKEFPELNGKIAKGSPEGAEARLKETQTFFDTSKTLEWTGIKQWIPLEQTIKDAVAQLLSFQKASSAA